MPWFPALPMLHFFAFTVYLMLIVYLFSANLKSTLTISAAGLFTCLAFWSGGMVFIHNHSTPENVINFIYTAYALGWIFFPPFALWLAMEVSEIKPPAIGVFFLIPLFLPAPLFMAAHVSGLLIAPPMLLDYGWFAEWLDNPWVKTYFIYYFSYTAAGAAILFYSAKSARFNVVKKQRLVIASSVVIVLLIGTFIEVVLPHMKKPAGFMGDISDLFILILAAATLFSIRYLKLFDITLSPAEKEIISNMDDYFILLDNSFRVQYVNSRVVEFTGQKESDLIGMPFSGLTGSHMGLEKFYTSIRTNGFFKSHDFYLSRPDGSALPVMISASPLKEMGELKSIICVASDFTEIKKAQDFLRATNERLRELDDIKSRFSAMVSHDLRTPLSSIAGFAYLLRREAGDTLGQKLTGYLDLINSNSERLMVMINDLLEVSRLESGNYTLNKKPAGITALINTCTLNMLSLCGSRDITIRFTADQPEVTVDMDPDRMTQVITNLLANAIKFSGAGSEITVNVTTVKRDGIKFPPHADYTAAAPCYVEIDIADKGVGMEKSHLEKVFDRFYQVRIEGIANPNSSGLGLNIVKNLVELHDGFVWAESHGLNTGTTMKVLLPYNC